jgi:hypothetical protein
MLSTPATAAPEGSSTSPLRTAESCATAEATHSTAVRHTKVNLVFNSQPHVEINADRAICLPLANPEERFDYEPSWEESMESGSAKQYFKCITPRDGAAVGALVQLRDNLCGVDFRLGGHT